MTNELLVFVRSQLDAKEREAREFLAQPGRDLLAARLYQEQLAEVEAKRRILDECDSMITGWTHEETKEFGRDILRALAQPFAGRDGWREEWRA